MNREFGLLTSPTEQALRMIAAHLRTSGSSTSQHVLHYHDRRGSIPMRLSVQAGGRCALWMNGRVQVAATLARATCQQLEHAAYLSLARLLMVPCPPIYAFAECELQVGIHGIAWQSQAAGVFTPLMLAFHDLVLQLAQRGASQLHMAHLSTLQVAAPMIAPTTI